MPDTIAHPVKGPVCQPPSRDISPSVDAWSVALSGARDPAKHPPEAPHPLSAAVERYRPLDDATAQWRRRRAGLLDSRARDLGGSHWHRARAEGLRRGWAESRARCGQELPGVVVACMRCRRTHPASHRCGHALCESCSRRRWAALRARLLPAMARYAKLGRCAPRVQPIRCDSPSCTCRSLGAARPRWQMLTLTVPHSGDLTQDLVALQNGWRLLRSWLASLGERRPLYVRVLEVTPGRDGSGHAHLHVVRLAGPICYRRLHHAWARVHGVSPRAIRGPHVSWDRDRDGAAAAKYVATYVTKGVGAELPVDTAARWVEARYGRRLWTRSQALRLRPSGVPCPECAAPAPVLRRLSSFTEEQLKVAAIVHDLKALGRPPPT